MILLYQLGERTVSKRHCEFDHWTMTSKKTGGGTLDELLQDDMIKSVKEESKIPKAITMKIGAGEAADSGDTKNWQTFK
jgi:hypothetical protein